VESALPGYAAFLLSANPQLSVISPNDFARRQAEQGQKGWLIQRIPGLEHLSRSDARAVEQVLIEQYGLNSLLNKINSIAASNPIYSEAVRRGQEILDIVGIPR
jgi:filamentous hemagglutinin